MLFVCLFVVRVGVKSGCRSFHSDQLYLFVKVVIVVTLHIFTCAIPMKPDWGRLMGDSSEDSSGGMIDKLNIQYMRDSIKGTEPV